MYDWRAASASGKLLASTVWRNVSAQWVRLGDVILGCQEASNEREEAGEESRASGESTPVV